MKVFIHVNDLQVFAAKVAKYTIEKSSAHNDKFTIEYIHLNDYPHLKNMEGREYLRKGMPDKWKNDDLQSFTPLRFLPPELMNYSGRAIVIDPDIFGIGDIYDLLTRDMHGHAILCRKIPDSRFPQGHYWGSSVMLLDCSKLKHWQWEKMITKLFTKKIDYRDWISLFLEDEKTLGELEEEWNSFDKLTDETKLLHNTGRLTQPWKTGLVVNFQVAEKSYQKPKQSLWDRLRGKKPPEPKKAKKKLPEIFQTHPDQKQIDFFFQNLAECMDKGIITANELQEEIRKNNIRADAFEVLQQYRDAGGQKKAG